MSSPSIRILFAFFLLTVNGSTLAWTLDVDKL